MTVLTLTPLLEAPQA